MIDGASNKKHPFYGIWNGMMQRCYNTKLRSYSRYGGRGISVCLRWHTFENFVADMSPRPHGLSVERRDTNGNYSPDNCCWATATEQARNRRSNKLTVDQANEILGHLEHGECALSVAKRFGLTGEMVNYIRRGEVYRELAPFDGSSIDHAKKIFAEEVITSLQRGEMVNAIAVRLGVTRSALGEIRRGDSSYNALASTSFTQPQPHREIIKELLENAKGTLLLSEIALRGRSYS